MNKTTKTVLIVAAVGVAAYIGYQWWQKRQQQNGVAVTVPPGSAPNAGTATNGTNVIQSGTDFWNDLRNIWT